MNKKENVNQPMKTNKTTADTDKYIDLQIKRTMWIFMADIVVSLNIYVHKAVKGSMSAIFGPILLWNSFSNTFQSRYKYLSEVK